MDLPSPSSGNRDEVMGKLHHLVSPYEDVMGEAECCDLTNACKNIYQCRRECWGSGKAASQRVTGTCADDTEALVLGGQDLDRIMLKASLWIPAARQALVRELVGLANVDCHGNPAMSIAHGFDQRFAGLQMVHSVVAFSCTLIDSFKRR